MHTPSLNILVVDENRFDAEMVYGALRGVPRLAFTLKHAEDIDSARGLLGQERFDVLIVGMYDGEPTGLATVEAACRAAEHLPVVAMGADDDELAAASVRLGAQDYLVKIDLDGWSLARAIRHAVERKEVVRYQELAAQVLRQLDSSGHWTEVMAGVTRLIKRHTGADAVGIRLIDGEDFPYFVTEGFPERFLVQENSLCTLGVDGQVVRDERGQPVLHCLCGMVLGGHVQADNPHFTPGGSFWTNSTSTLRASDSLPGVAQRHVCNETGYESMALVPIRGQGRPIGLLQVNDSRLGRFSGVLVRFLEQIAAAIGIGVLRRQAEIALRRERDFIDRVLATADVLVVVLDPQGRIVRFNQACQALTGYRFEDVRGRAFWDLFVAPEEADGARRAFANLHAELFPHSHENDWLTRQGRRRRIAWSNSCLLDEAGDVEFVVGTGVALGE
ncbi:MAG: PAS domain S-box protein [Planctomycetota bacterium]|nr:PAS domain S-box protein [Planctomycetota bacterium]